MEDELLLSMSSNGSMRQRKKKSNRYKQKRIGNLFGSSDVSSVARYIQIIAIGVLVAIAAGVIGLGLAGRNYGRLSDIEESGLASQTQDLVINTDPGSGSSTVITETKITTETLEVDTICPTSIEHMEDGTIPSTHVVQYISANESLSLGLPADLTAYAGKTFKLYAKSSMDQHVVTIAPGGASWDPFHQLRFLRFMSRQGAGVTFHVIDESQIAIISATGVLRCASLDPTTCVAVDQTAYRSAIVTPEGGITEGAFRWPDVNGDAIVEGQSKRNFVAQSPVFPAVNPGATFPSETAVQFSSITEALNALRGTIVEDTKIFVEPGVYQENILIDGMFTASQTSGSALEPNPRRTRDQGLQIIGDSRVFMGLTVSDCFESSQNREFEVTNSLGSYNLFQEWNCIIPVSADTFSIATCPSVPASGIVDKASPSTARVPFNDIGMQVGDSLLIFETETENHVVNVTAVNDFELTIDITPLSGDITTIFPSPMTIDKCGNSITFLPNRKIEGQTLQGDGDSFERDASIAAVSVLQDAKISGFWIQGTESNMGQNTTQFTVFVSAGLVLHNSVVDSTKSITTQDSSSRVGFVMVSGSNGHLTNHLTSVDALFRENTTTGLSEYIEQGMPVTFTGSTEEEFTRTLFVSGPSASALLVSPHFLVSGFRAEDGGHVTITNGMTCVLASNSIRADSGSTIVWQSTAFFKCLDSGSSCLNVDDGSSAHGSSMVVYGGSTTSSVLTVNDGGVINIASMDNYGTANSVALSTTTGQISVGSIGQNLSPDFLSIEGIPTYSQGSVQIDGSKIFSVINAWDPRYGTILFDDSSSLSQTIDCSIDTPYTNREYAVYATDARAYTLTLTNCGGLAFPGGIGTTATFGGAIGDGLTFRIMDDQFIVISVVINVT